MNGRTIYEPRPREELSEGRGVRVGVGAGEVVGEGAEWVGVGEG